MVALSSSYSESKRWLVHIFAAGWWCAVGMRFGAGHGRRESEMSVGF